MGHLKKIKELKRFLILTPNGVLENRSKTIPNHKSETSLQQAVKGKIYRGVYASTQTKTASLDTKNYDRKTDLKIKHFVNQELEVNPHLIGNQADRKSDTLDKKIISSGFDRLRYL